MKTPDLERTVELTIENWRELGVPDDSGDLGPLLPSLLRVRKHDGTLEERPCNLMLVEQPRRIRARNRAREWALKLGLDPLFEPDPVRGGGADASLVNQLENLEIMAYAIRDAKAPYDQTFISGEVIFQQFKTLAPFEELYARLDDWTRMNDPRYGELSPEKTWEVISKVAREGHPLPLAGLDGRSQLACIVVSARAAMRSPTCPSRLRWRQGSRSDSTNSSELEPPNTEEP